MGNILSAIQDDIKEYEYLCRKYKEEVQTKFDAYGNRGPDCYGSHAQELKNRLQEESQPKAEASAPDVTPVAEESLEDGAPIAYSKFTVSMEEECANKLKAIFPDMPSITFIQTALTILAWIHEEEAKGKVILSSTPEGTDVIRLVPLIEIAKQK